MTYWSAPFWLLLLIGPLIAWHEFGHYWVARKLGVKVLRYAIGFGPTLWSRRGSDDIEYAVNAIPLGGYVKFADEREGEVASADLSRAFNRQALWKRSAIVFAGPLANLLLTVAAFWLMFLVGVSDFRPVLGENSGQAAAAGLRANDEIIAINGAATPNWTQVFLELTTLGYAKAQAVVQVRDQAGAAREVTLDLSQLPKGFDEGGLLKELGLTTRQSNPDARVGMFPAESPARRAGVQLGDRIVAINGAPVANAKQVRDTLQLKAEQAGGKIELLVERDGATRTIIVPAQRVEATSADGKPSWLIGVGWEYAEVTRRHGPIDAVGAALQQTGMFFVKSVQTIHALLVGEASTKNVSGVITIAQVAQISGEGGLAEFLRTMALVSLSLFIINLLPVPILDGGHLMYYFVEWIKGSPVPESAQMVGQAVGLAFIFGLMSLALYNDLARVLG